MENYTCQSCGKEIPEANRVLHGLSCKNTISNEEFTDLIPCEYCNHFISFADYATHIGTCEAQMTFLPSFSSILTAPLLNSRPTINNEVAGAAAEEAAAATEEAEETAADEEEIEEPQPHQEYDFFAALDDMLNRIQNDGLFNIPINNGLVEGVNEDNYENLTNLGETIGNVEIGLDNSYDYLKSKTYSSDCDFICNICQTKKLESHITVCGHEFCKECSEIWFLTSKKCPYCNLELQKIQK